MSNGLWRPTRGGSLDYLFTIGANNVLDVTFSITQYSEGSKLPIDFEYPPSKIGLPSYIDDKAGSQNVLPLINISGMAYYASSGHAAARRVIGHPANVDQRENILATCLVVDIAGQPDFRRGVLEIDRKSTRLNSSH